MGCVCARQSVAASVTDIDVAQTDFSSRYPLAADSKVDMSGPDSIEKFRSECHWLIKDLVLVGAYPLTAEYTEKLVETVGIGTFVCLADMEREMKMYSNLTNYWDVWLSELRESMDLLMLNSPIADFSTADDDTMVNFVDGLVQTIVNEKEEARKGYYIHCLTGHGRTGIVSALLLMCLYRLEWQDALQLMKQYHAYRDCTNGSYFYNACKRAMSNTDRQFDAKKHAFKGFYPMPQEKSQFEQLKRLQPAMHRVHDKHLKPSAD